MLEENAIKVSNVSNVGASTSIGARSKAGVGGTCRVPYIDDKVRQVTINGDGEWLTAINSLLEEGMQG